MDLPFGWGFGDVVHGSGVLPKVPLLQLLSEPSSISFVGPHCKTSTLRFCNLHHRSIRVHNWGCSTFGIKFHGSRQNAGFWSVQEAQKIVFYPRWHPELWLSLSRVTKNKDHLKHKDLDENIVMDN